MLTDDLKKRITQAMKDKKNLERDILRLALSEIQAVDTRTGTPATDDEAVKIIKKLIKSNSETIEIKTDEASKQPLREENAILEGLLPKTWGVDQIAAALAAIATELKAAKSDGQATGVAMKHLKTLAATVEGKDVGEAVKKVRAS